MRLVPYQVSCLGTGVLRQRFGSLLYLTGFNFNMISYVFLIDYR